MEAARYKILREIADPHCDPQARKEIGPSRQQSRANRPFVKSLSTHTPGATIGDLAPDATPFEEPLPFAKVS